jgi:hypothetical protein
MRSTYKYENEVKAPKFTKSKTPLIDPPLKATMCKKGDKLPLSKCPDGPFIYFRRVYWKMTVETHGFPMLVISSVGGEDLSFENKTLVQPLEIIVC